MYFLGFKSLLVTEGGEIFSPLHHLCWERQEDPLLGEVVAARTPASELDDVGGIYGGAYHIARSYLRPGRQLFLIAPHPDAFIKTDVPECWRADHAFIVDRVVSIKKAARLILASYRAGLAQLDCMISCACAALWEEMPADEKQEILRHLRLEITQYLLYLRPSLRVMIARAAGHEPTRYTVVTENDMPPTKTDWRITVGCLWPQLQAVVDGYA